MPKENKKPKKNAKKYVIVGVIVAALALLVGLSTAYISTRTNKNSGDSSKSYPLDTELEYIGQSSYGCTGFCDAQPGVDYYYATDLSPQEIVNHFSKATLDATDDIDPAHNPSDHQTFSLRTPTNDQIYVSYYVNGPGYAKNFNLIATKKHIIFIPSTNYEAAKASL